MAVVVQLSVFLEKIKPDPVVETGNLSSFDLSYERRNLIIPPGKIAKDIYSV